MMSATLVNAFTLSYEASAVKVLAQSLEGQRGCVFTYCKRAIY